MTSQAVLHGSTSGTATLLAAAVSGASVLTLPAATDTIAVLADVTGGIATHAALQTGVHGISIAAGKTLTASNTLTLTATDGSTLAIGTGGTLGSAAYTASSAYEAAGGIATHAALTTGVHGLAITAGQTLTVTTGGTLGSAAYTASTAYEAAGGIATHAALTTTHGVSGAIVGTTDTQELSAKTLNASVGKGTWTASGTWTLPAFTLGGTVTSNGQSFSGTIANLGTVTTVDINGGTVDGAVIGGASAAAGTFTSLTATGAVALSPANANVVLSPTGTGLVTISPATAGAMNNVVIGASTPLAGTFTTLSATGALTVSGTGLSSIAGALKVTGTNPGSIGANAGVLDYGGTEGVRIFSYGADASTNGIFQWRSQRGDGSNDLTVLRSTTAGDLVALGTLTVSGNSISGSGAGTLRAVDGLRIGADSTNNLLDAASAGAGTATLYIGNASINVTSDRRLKANIKAVVDTYSDVEIWDMVDRSRVVTHTWNDPSDRAVNNRNTRGPFVGLIAQEQKEVTPWAVNKPLNEADPWFIEHVHLVPLLMRDAQITHGHIRDHEEDIEALKAWKGRAETALAEHGITVH